VVALFVTLGPLRSMPMCIPPRPRSVPQCGLVRALIVHALKDGRPEGKRTAANSDGAALASFRPSFAPRQLGLAALTGLSDRTAALV
jgi:DNA mismatch repair protein MutL